MTLYIDGSNTSPRYPNTKIKMVVHCALSVSDLALWVSKDVSATFGSKGGKSNSGEREA
jgi:hypothetical protein